MAFTDDEIKLIRMTWARATMASAQTSTLFYEELFRRAPEARPLFRSDLEVQGKKLMATLAFIVDHLDRHDVLLPAAESLAKRHVEYGVAADQYPVVGETLLWALGELLGSDFGAAERKAWEQAYDTLTKHMIATAYPEVA